ncbi:MAG: choice-of-anchor Q domain-containing protein [Vicingaceae bacterium]
MFKRLLIFVFGVLVLFSCRREDQIIDDDSARLNFSVDSITFDTVFTTIGSITENFLVYNPYKETIKISSIRLNGGNQSTFRINVDGAPGPYHENVEIAPEDSMFIFVEATVDPNNQLNPFVIEDFIEFNTNGNRQQVDLVAWGQNAIYFTPTTFNTNLPDFTCLTGPCSDSLPPVNVTWNNSLPYVVYGYVAVDSLDQLNIDPGVQIYFHNNSGIWVYRGGTLKVNGTKDEPVVFQNDRLEMRYDDVPGQWDRIWINEGGFNEINYAIIKNAFIGIQAEALFIDQAPSFFGNLNIKNTVIDNCSGFGLLSAVFNINAENLLITDCGEYNVALQGDGIYNFDHCTFANYFTAASRETPLFFAQNSYNTPLGLLVDTPTVRVRNSIIYGRLESEFDTEVINSGQLNLNFSNTIIKTNNPTSDTTQFTNIIKNPVGPIFIDGPAGMFELDDNSVAIDAGDITVGNQVPLDLKGDSRTADGMPDLGAYEF